MKSGVFFKLQFQVTVENSQVFSVCHLARNGPNRRGIKYLVSLFVPFDIYRWESCFENTKRKFLVLFTLVR